jgi:drug/metabolite transporter (DMT)-like permease
VVAVILGALFIGEALNARTLIAGGIILAAVALIVVARNRVRASRRPRQKGGLAHGQGRDLTG